MCSISKSLALILIAVIAISSACLLTVKPASAQGIPTPFPPPQLPTENFTYDVSNYIVNYSIEKLPPPDDTMIQYASIINPYYYNLHVYVNYPPFAIAISFYEQDLQNVTEKITIIAHTNEYSENIGCWSYPTQITMIQLNSESVPPTITPQINFESTSPSPTPTIPEFSALLILPLLLVTFSIVLGFMHRKVKHG